MPPWPLTRRRLLGLAALAVLLLAALAINFGRATPLFYPRATAQVAALPAAPGYRAGQRVLFVSPHPDDETLCCAGSIQQALAAGAQVWVVWLTSGDGFEFDAILLNRSPRPGRAAMARLGERRMGEARAAARVLGVPPQHLLFLGYPDGGLLHLFLENYATPYASRYTGRTRVEYAGTVEPGAPYTGQSVERDLTRVLDTVRPDVVLVPSPEDQHPDHRAASYFVTRLLALRGEQDRARYWIVHGGLEWPVPKGLHADLPLLLPQRGRGLPWARLALTAAQEDRKLAAIRAYRSQTEVLDRFMLAFVRENELLSPEGVRQPR